jgi:uncharacterized protein YchJ
VRVLKMKTDVACPCASGKTYAECCKLVHEDIRSARKPEQVVRARFSAQVLGNMDFFRQSIVSKYRSLPSVDNLAITIGRQRIQSVTILRTNRQGWLRRGATVECRVSMGEKHVSSHQERAYLKRDSGAWRVLSGAGRDVPAAEPDAGDQ